MRRRTLMSAAVASGVGLLAGCASPDVAHYARERPELDLRRYFNGIVDGYGVFTDRSGKVVRRFTVVMNCSWQGNKGVLDEDFTYSDGELQKRIWRLEYLGGGQYVGTADDVKGEARGQSQGNAFRWEYTLKLPFNQSVVEVQFDDWMYLMDERVMLNRAEMSKLGVRLGEVTLAFVRRSGS